MTQALELFRHAARSLLRSPGHTVLIVVTLAVGIAASTSVFSVMNPYLLRPLPYAEAGSLLQVEQVEEHKQRQNRLEQLNKVFDQLREIWAQLP